MDFNLSLRGCSRPAGLRRSPLLNFDYQINKSYIGSKLLFKPALSGHQLRSEKLVCRADASNKQQGKVAVPPSSPKLPSLPTVKPISWAFAAGMITISVAALSLSRNIFRATKKLSLTETSTPATPLSSAEEAAVASVGPLLLAAETAAAVDETVHLSQEELEKLDFNLRMLITNMDSQLAELQDEIMPRLPPGAIAAWDAISAEIAAVEEQLASLEDGSEESAKLETQLTDYQWDIFGVLQPHAAEESKRSYRSLLYNRGVQAQLLRQVERQMSLRGKMQQVQAQLEALEKGESTTEQAPTTSVPTVQLAVAGCSIPHPRKRATGGEDAFFASNELFAFGVADGVGGWASNGVDPAEYPRKLIAQCEIGAARHCDPLDILVHAYQKAHCPGSCTVALACIDGDYLRIASLGDCGTRVIRDGRVVFASEVQEHRFNQPYQMGSPQYHPGNVPEDAHRYSVMVRAGDVIIMGSDGLWDNLWDHELEDAVHEELGVLNSTENLQKVGGVSGSGNGNGGSSEKGAGAMPEEQQRRAQKLADRLAYLASEHSLDVSYKSPFAAEKHTRLVPASLRQIVIKPSGGKLDDVTAVAAIVF